MQRWWGVRYDRRALTRLYGPDLDQSAILLTLARGLPHEQAAAMGVLGQARVARAVPALAGQLSHDYPLLRYVARRALEDIVGGEVPVNVNLPAAEVTAEARAWLARYQNRAAQATAP